MDFGIFVCSACAGIHRELSHKVKGVSMSNFTDKEAEFLAKWGNEVILVFLYNMAIECIQGLNGRLQIKAIPWTRQERYSESQGVL